MDKDTITLLVASLLFLGTLLTAIFARRNSRDGTDVSRIDVMFTEQNARITDLKDQVSDLRGEVGDLTTQLATMTDEKREDSRRLRAAGLYIADLLAFIGRHMGHVAPPLPREPLE